MGTKGQAVASQFFFSVADSLTNLMKLYVNGIHILEPLSWPHRDHSQKFPTSTSTVEENPVLIGVSETHTHTHTPGEGGNGVWLTEDGLYFSFT